MQRLLIGMLVGMVLMATPAWGLRTERPPEFIPEWDTNRITQLNNFLLGMFNIFNGRYQLEITTSDPDGVRRGEKGEMILFDPGANEEFCVNIDGATDWECTDLT